MTKYYFTSLLSLILSLSSCKPSLTEDFNSRMEMISSAELGTVEYTIVKVVKANDEQNLKQLKIGDRKILLSAKARLKAGITLNGEYAYKAEINEELKSVRLILPKPQILTIDMSPEGIKLEYEHTGIFRFNFTNEERNTLLRQAEKDIKNDKKIMENILNDAQDNARMFFNAILSQVGFRNIIIVFQDIKQEK